MNPLTFIVEPERLLLTWQPRDEASPERSRRTVGEIWLDEVGAAHFRYLSDSEDFKVALDHGFEGFPSFDRKLSSTSSGVLESLIRRLPPRSREDFEEFLAQHRLPFPFNGSDLALLGYTGAKLPSDGFALVPVFPAESVPCDYITEVAGLRHVFHGDVSSIKSGDSIRLAVDQTNKFDPDAVEVIWQDQRIGFINRAMRHVVGTWIRSKKVEATVERVNGRPDRPLVFIRLEVR